MPARGADDGGLGVPDLFGDDGRPLAPLVAELLATRLRAAILRAWRDEAFRRTWIAVAFEENAGKERGRCRRTIRDITRALEAASRWIRDRQETREQVAELLRRNFDTGFLVTVLGHPRAEYLWLDRRFHGLRRWYASRRDRFGVGWQAFAGAPRGVKP